MNPSIKKLEYAVRGPLVIRATEIEKELEKVRGEEREGTSEEGTEEGGEGKGREGGSYIAKERLLVIRSHENEERRTGNPKYWPPGEANEFYLPATDFPLLLCGKGSVVNFQLATQKFAAHSILMPGCKAPLAVYVYSRYSNP